MNTRRQFIANCSTAMAGLVCLPARSLAALRDSASPAPMTYAAFAPQVNTVFRVQTESGQVVNLTLIKARRTPSWPVAPGRKPPGDADNEKFSLLFDGPRKVELPPAIHSFEHDQLGRMEIYIGEVGPRDPASLRYEAIFNYPKPVAVNLRPRLT